jgi:hypothetical protein
LYQFARERRCLIDDYAQIYRDFKPFYQLAAHQVTSFQSIIDRIFVTSGIVGDEELNGSGAEITRMEVRESRWGSQHGGRHGV